MNTSSKILVLLHGFFGSPEDWSGVVENLRNKFGDDELEVVIPDLRATATRPEITDLESFAEWFNRGIRQRRELRGATTVFIAGYSMGARLAAQALVSASDADPDLYSRALLISVHPGFDTSDFNQKQSRLQNDLQWAQRLKTDSWNTIWSDWNSQTVLKEGSRNRVNEVGDEAAGSDSIRSSAESHRHAWGRAMEIWSLAHQSNLARELLKWAESESKSPAPRLAVMTGNEDTKFTELAAHWVGGQKNIRLRTVLGAGHRVLREAPDDVASEIALLLQVP